MSFYQSNTDPRLIFHWDHVSKVEERFIPVVVIDPENREQVHLLTEAFAVNEGRYSDPVGDMQAALREFANPAPPKPEEPQGQWAVVRDEHGHRWVRTDEYPDVPWWGLDDPGHANWEAIDVTGAPLSEGVVQS